MEKFGEDVIADINQYWNNFSETVAVQVTPLWEIVEIAMEKFIRLKEGISRIVTAVFVRRILNETHEYFAVNTRNNKPFRWMGYTIGAMKLNKKKKMF